MNFINALFGYPLGFIMWFCYTIIPNYGIALVVFTILTKLLLVPLAIKQQKGTVAMTLIRPKMDELQKKYKDNKEKLNEEMMKLYQEENYNPMSGCLPLLIQFPILFGLIDVIYKPLTHILRLPADIITKAQTIATDVLQSQGLAINPYSAQISIVSAVQSDAAAFGELGADIVAKISSFDMTFLGIDLGMTPTLAWNLLILIPILSGITSLGLTLFSMKQTAPVGDAPNPASGMTKGMMYIMPLFSVYFAFMVPAGVGFYWLLSNIFSTVQSILLFKYFNPKELAEKAQAEYELKKEQQRQEKIEAKKLAKAGDEEAKEKSLSQKEINRMKLAAARKRDAEKYGIEYVEVTDDDLK